MAADVEHYDIVVEVNRPKVEFFADLADLSVGESEAFLQAGTTVMFAYCVFVALLVVLDSDTFEVAVFEDAIFHKIITVKSTNPLKRVIVMLSNADDPIFLQDEAIPLSLVEALLIPEQSLISEVDNHRLVSRYFLLFSGRSCCVFHETHEKLFKSVHILREMLGEDLENFPIFDWLFIDNFLELIVDKLADHNHIILYNHRLSVQFILSKHPVNGPFSSLLFSLRFHP